MLRVPLLIRELTLFAFDVDAYDGYSVDLDIPARYCIFFGGLLPSVILPSNGRLRNEGGSGVRTFPSCRI